jgi:hypothetical protein
MHDITLISPAQLDGPGEAGDFPLDAFALRFLAQGDSWFSIGAIPPFLTSNLFDQLVLSQAAVAVNCARPGAELQHMTDSTTNRVFLQLLSGKRARPWTALLLSGLGNDVISAAQAGPASAPGQRLLATRAEWAAGGDAGRYLSAEGWDTFCQHAKDGVRGAAAQPRPQRHQPRPADRAAHLRHRDTARCRRRGRFRALAGPGDAGLPDPAGRLGRAGRVAAGPRTPPDPGHRRQRAHGAGGRHARHADPCGHHRHRPHGRPASTGPSPSASR